MKKPKADDAELSARAQTLREQLEQASYEYHVLDRPTISDKEYDVLYRELLSLEEEHPTLRTADSPTQRVGAEPISERAKHVHLVPMLSLANAFNEEELSAWEERLVRIAGDDVRRAGYTCELKIDGAAISLTYQDGVLIEATTRGNGTVGESVTPNVRTIREIPLRLRGTGHPPLMEIRGEVYMPFSGFERINEECIARGEEVFANPRNAAAGAVRRLDPRVAQSFPLRFFGYAMVLPNWRGRLRVTTEIGIVSSNSHRWGLPVAPHYRRCAGIADAHAWSSERGRTQSPRLTRLRDRQRVVKVNALALWPDLGIVGGREPRYAIARKFAPDIAETTLLGIEVNVGRTGTINPFAVLEPVEIGGAQVKQATLSTTSTLVRAERTCASAHRVQVKRARARSSRKSSVRSPTSAIRQIRPRQYVPPTQLSVVWHPSSGHGK